MYADILNGLIFDAVLYSGKVSRVKIFEVDLPQNIS